ncbi:TPA: DUF1617 family protein [Staphylococcus pseudintermedius]|uniref:DUF1617 family protein n=1 Tax=Staphylococcus pseudintermedius TaxID=283734 RepID=UPI0010329340|nr:DUF1617 family protein [Staphylococcus pseudintermedius]EHD5218227.1 DUF1617 family protein [Staphylococcus pseudintermedius]EHT1759603.1 DUF1617 family protein [Staphylococcus pseudintermedius]EII2699868.1 DUF1617 family protein [Staphylococcus pseudintermedius]EJG0087835.1 DUF1617 family protein [Staphylococcus pseudintermedius]EJG1228484.1 DUF1617 family protein [Staphylococcus pseudintermedius]
MKLTLKNVEINKVSTFMYKLELKAKQSRSRTKFMRLLDEKQEEYKESNDELLSMYAVKDEAGQPKIVDNQYEFENGNLEKYIDERAELDNEEVIINLEDYPKVFETLFEVLDELDIQLKEEDAVTYDRLCEVFRVE